MCLLGFRVLKERESSSAFFFSIMNARLRGRNVLLLGEIYSSTLNG